MNQLMILAVSLLHIICLVTIVEATYEQDCASAQRQGNTCDLSAWICAGSCEKQTLKITFPNGRWSSKWQTRCPCRGGGGGGGGGAKPECEDKQTSQQCQKWKRAGYCTQTYVAYMRKNCCNTCKGGSTAPVAVNGGWSEWSGWSGCSKECGGGRKEAVRQCNNPRPKNGGRNCGGQATKSTSCNTQACTGGGTGPAPGGRPGAGTAQAKETGCLASINYYRALHRDTPSLIWDAELTRKATAYAKVLMAQALRNGKVSLDHDPANGPEKMGENLFYVDHWNTGDDAYYCRQADKAWYAEILDFSYGSMQTRNGKAVGHFTQQVWVASRKVGYGIAVVDSPTFGPSNKMAIVVAKYTPRGNFNTIGRRFQDYSDNIKPCKGNCARYKDFTG